MRYATINDEFRRLLPELEAQIERDEQDGPYIVFGMVVRPWLEATLAESGTESKVAEAFQLFERMAKSEDSETVNFVWIEVGELLVEWRIRNEPLFERARPHVGPELLSFTRQIAESPMFGLSWDESESRGWSLRDKRGGVRTPFSFER